jgi:hypothetical protein
VKTEFEVVSENIACFDLRLFRIVAEFGFLGSSMLEYLYALLSNKCYVRLFNLIAIVNIAFPFFGMEVVMNKQFDSVYLEKMKDMIEYRKFCYDFYESKRPDFSAFQKSPKLSSFIGTRSNIPRQRHMLSLFDDHELDQKPC